MIRSEGESRNSRTKERTAGDTRSRTPLLGLSCSAPFFFFSLSRLGRTDVKEIVSRESRPRAGERKLFVAITASGMAVSNCDLEEISRAIPH